MTTAVYQDVDSILKLVDTHPRPVRDTIAIQMQLYSALKNITKLSIIFNDEIHGFLKKHEATMIEKFNKQPATENMSIEDIISIIKNYNDPRYFLSVKATDDERNNKIDEEKPIEIDIS